MAILHIFIVVLDLEKEVINPNEALPSPRRKSKCGYNWPIRERQIITTFPAEVTPNWCLSTGIHPKLPPIQV